MRNSKIGLSVVSAVFLVMGSFSTAQAAALARTIPYTEAICNTNPDIFFCEDFEGEDINCLGFNNCGSTWGNPAIETKDICFCGGGSYQFNTASLPPFAANNRVWRVTKTQSFTDVVTGFNTGTGNGEISAWLKPAIFGTGAQEWWGRIQVWFSADHSWPADLDFKMFFALPRTFIDPPSAAYETGMQFHQDFACTIDFVLTGFNDVPVIRYSSNFAIFPYQNEYCPPLSPGVAPDGVHAPRFQKERWYTLEYHVKLAPDTTGVLDMWVDGVQAYHTNRITCANGCADMGYISILGWMHGADPKSGYYEVDNVVLSRTYIGPPVSGPPASSPPAAATSTRITTFAVH